MTKTGLVAAIARECGLPKREVTRIVDTMFDVIASALRRGDRVAIAGIGTFEVRRRAARNGRNPKTGEAIALKSSRAPAFRPAKRYRDQV